MNRKNIITVVLTILFFISSPDCLIYAGNTGKIIGVVKDKATGETLVGVTVQLKGTSLGAVTNSEGSFYILRVNPGTYQLDFSYIGYRKLSVKNVVVRVDLTTEINAELESSAFEMTTVEIVADQPLIQKDVTSTRKIESGDKLRLTPGIESTSDVFRVFGGAVIDAQPQSLNLANGSQLQVRDQSLQDVHIRGGRGGEILFMVDGMPVTHPIYGGRSVLDLNVNDVDNIELLTGAFNAEYGQAQSGVINITTRSGKDYYEGGLEYRTDELGIWGDSYNTRYLSFNYGGPEPLTRTILPKLGVNVPGKFDFFISANTNMSNTPYDNHRTRRDISVMGISLKERQDNSFSLNGKLDWENGKGIYMALSYHGSFKDWSRFDWLWKDFPDNTAAYKRDNQNINFRFTHTLSSSTYYNLNFGYLGVNYNASLNNSNPSDFWTFYPDSMSYANKTGINYSAWQSSYGNRKPFKMESRIQPPSISPVTGFFDKNGCENIWRDDLTKSFTFRGDITSQIHPEHLVKLGLEAQYHDIRYVDIQDGGVTLSPYGNMTYKDGTQIAPPPGPYKEFGQNRWVFNAYPLIGAAYLQDKFEKSFMVINAGLRIDWFMPGASVNSSDWKKQWELATGLKADWGKASYALSPRFGISFPVSTQTVLFFSYGHFTQIPELQFYYRDPFTGSFTGNPKLKFEKTILYEFGFTQQLGEDWAADVKSYAKDISDQVGTTRMRTTFGIPVDLYDNVGYARARGIEFELTKKYSYFLSGKVTYTAQWTSGYSSSAFEDYIRSSNDMPKPIRERRLSWDVRHQVVAEASISSPKGNPIELFGFTLPDMWDITLLSNLSSGQPYTPGTTDPFEIQVLENTKTGPPIFNTDIKIKKYFDIGGMQLSFYLDVFNLFDQKNTQIGYGFNPWTGNPYIYGDVFQDSFQGYTWKEMVVLRDLRQFSTGRYSKFGISLNF